MQLKLKIRRASRSLATSIGRPEVNTIVYAHNHANIVHGEEIKLAILIVYIPNLKLDESIISDLHLPDQFHYKGL